jgi:tRNA dimethylallyltransferase
MDVGQFYHPLTIGTAKPDWRSSTITHHLFDIVDKPIDYTVVAYKKDVLALVHQIRARGNMPILVGGSGFYLKSLFFTPIAVEVHNNPPMQACDDEKSLWDTLYAIDPQRAHAIQPHDTYRIQRALAIWYASGIKPSAYKPVYHNDFGRYAVVGLFRDRDDLYTRINNRVVSMFDAGWVDEVRSLSPAWIDFIRRKKIIGYNEIDAYLNNENPTIAMYNQLIEDIAQRTRQYARRQMIFWRMLIREFQHAWQQEAGNRPLHIDITMTKTSLIEYKNQLDILYRTLSFKD